MKEKTILYFSGADLRAILTMEKCIEAMATAFRALSSGELEH